MLLGALVWVAGASFASAQTEDPTRAAAREHFQQGLELAEEGRYAQALDEFLAAHQLTGNYAVLYNIAQSHIALRDPIAAISALEQYLEEGAGQIDGKRVEQVELQLAPLKAELATLTILSSADGSEVSIDGQPRGKLPLPKALWLVPGDHDIRLSTAEGSVRRTVHLRASEQLEIKLEPPVAAPLPPSTLAIECPESVQVWVDGARAEVPSKNPSFPLPPGKRRVTLIVRGVSSGELVVNAEPGVMQVVRCQELQATLPPDTKSSPHPGLRTAGHIVGGVGLGLGAVALGTFFWNLARYERWESEHQALQGEESSEDYFERQTKNNELAQSIETASQVTLGLAVGSGVLVASGVTLVVLSGRSSSKANPEPSGFLLSYSAIW